MPSLFRNGPRTAGVLLALAGFVLLWVRSLWAGALGLECFAAAYWLWSRAADDAREQLTRWAWLRRPATALWLAATVHTVAPWPTAVVHTSDAGVAAALGLIESLAVVWAGLELLAALPVARPYADMSGPLLAMRPWLPAALPAAGFAVLWRHREHWMHVGAAREVAIVLLIVTAWLAVLRSLARRQWTSGLRWLFVSDSALAGVLVALDAVVPAASLLLWLGACGGRAYLLAGELRGKAPRRGPFLARLWRVAMGLASGSLAFPVLVALGSGPGGRAHGLYYLSAAIPVLIAAALTTRRHVEAPERRLVMRPNAVLSIGHAMAVATLVLGPLALLLAWWRGFEVSLPAIALAALPVAVGASIAMPGRAVPLRELTRSLARTLFRFVVERERALVGVLVRIARWLSAPLRDLHTGDAQEYLLFVIGVAVFALVIPFLR